MRHYAKLLRATLTALLMLVAIAGAAVAGPFEDRGAAYVRGDYATAMRLWRPLADQGDALAQSGANVFQRPGRPTGLMGNASRSGLKVARPLL